MLYDLLKNYKTTAVIGMCKNAGKTTVLNRLIREFAASNQPIGLTSIGRDGEKSDVVTNTGKPEIFVHRGTMIATASGVIEMGNVSREIYDVTDISTPMGNVIVFKAMSDGYVQLAGPSMTSQLKIIRNQLELFGAKHIFIDGALSRKSLSMPSVSEAAVLASGASYSPDINKTVQDTVYCVELLNLGETEYEIPTSEGKFMLISSDNTIGVDNVSSAVDMLRKNEYAALFIKGALTDSLASAFLSGGKFKYPLKMIAEDASRILLTQGTYKKLLLAGVEFAVQKKIHLAAVTVNPFSAYGLHYNAAEFTEKMENAIRSRVPVINVVEETKC